MAKIQFHEMLAQAELLLSVIDWSWNRNPTTSGIFFTFLKPVKTLLRQCFYVYFQSLWPPSPQERIVVSYGRRLPKIFPLDLIVVRHGLMLQHRVRNAVADGGLLVMVARSWLIRILNSGMTVVMSRAV